MDQSLQRYAGGTPRRRVPRNERTVVSQAVDLRNEVRIAAFKVAGSVALTRYAAEELCGLYDDFKDLAQEDAAKRVLLGELFGTNVGQVKKYQRNLFNPFGF